ncbi:MAG: tRNA (guanosine(37)-N1)-methyltransferase TrmD [Candidatus Bipolaricaulis sp.]|jgi:tRNA (guanine37-N1)-methyltransferase|uniref:tRNA (guanine-N(1)-)-methyltransferase n=1 Tax=Candidatus Bipolaricaulis anaerobius TaxID=2026885 RepID=A0A2X3MKY4_9BACT|nr:tRNA (guanosine(37)-N1)-methyltransferase TrmD [Candidatus Bipolaricaulis anaerobius]MBP7725956.1 tRNA (guanosine(37)-N1)-methyltransferase TrmD [Candidatus Bipolaricaulis sp.]SQD92564.1 tRNA (guanine-1-)-methyltransferase [Candidatus Bipolaricaulis anaerobius]
MRFDVVTLHPEMLLPFAAEGILRGAQDKGLIEIHLHDLRLFSPEGGIVDDRPFGGGAGMVMRPEPFARALAAIGREGGRTPYTVLLSAQGVRFSQEIAHALARERAVALLCGRYEGVDERVAARCDLELSIGDYVLAGGELAAAVVLETTARMVPGVVGRHESAATDSFYSGARLGYPQYTRPRVFQGMEVPAVLLSGDHEKIRRWREREAWRKTLRHRPDLVGLNLPPAERGEAP